MQPKSSFQQGKRREPKEIAKNRTAAHEYFIDETFEAGLVLTGTEVRSLRERNCQITDAFVLIRGGEAWLHGVHILPFSNGSIFNGDPDRKRKLLLHKSEIRKLNALAQVEGYSLIPHQLYFKDGRVKLELAVAKGKKLYDKRSDIASRDAKREMERALKDRNR